MAGKFVRGDVSRTGKPLRFANSGDAIEVAGETTGDSNDMGVHL
jgi:hypothetical protein